MNAIHVENKCLKMNVLVAYVRADIIVIVRGYTIIVIGVAKRLEKLMITDIERFTEGDCFILAKALHRLTGWPLWSFDKSGYPDHHGFVVMPDGRALDVEGPCKFSAFCRKWSMPISRAREFPYKAFHGHGTVFGLYSYERARVVAKRLLADLDNEAQVC